MTTFQALSRLLPAVVFLFITQSVAVGSQQSCSACAPGISSRPAEPSTISVCFVEGDFANNGDDVIAISAGIDYWTPWLTANNVVQQVTYRWGTSGDPCSYSTDRVVVSTNSSLGNAIGQASAMGNIEINPAHFGNTQYMNWAGAHEMGHVLGFHHDPAQVCNAFTVMTAAIDAGFSLGALGCADHMGLTELIYGSTEYTGGDEYFRHDGSDPFYEDCYEIWNATYLYWYDSSGNYHEVQIDSYDTGRWTCDPPI